MDCPRVIVKTALNAQKARQLAKSVGLIPHEKSQWRWALKQMRKANPAGIKGAPLMQSGRELAKTKETIGKLPNNVLQKLKALQRKQRLGVEVGINPTNKLVVGNIGRIHGKTLHHTHPIYNKILNIQNKSAPGIGRLLDNTLSASPSGVNYNHIKGTSWKKYVGLQDKREALIKIIKKVPKNNKNRISTINNIIDSVEKDMGNIHKSLTKDVSLDMDVIHRTQGKIHGILSSNTEGLHKLRPKLPRALRSVYFKGGL